MDTSEILETLKTTNNEQVQVNLLTGFIAKLPSKVICDKIVAATVIYKTAHSVLSRGMGDSSMRVLRFLTCLLRVARAPASPARDLVRRSGCLQDMANLFLGTMMMYEETWKTLCECLNESCKDCEDNQTYCSRLIPTCIQRCDARNTEVLKLLHTLLLNNTRNVHLFVESNGLNIFTSETIQDSSRMELLSIVVQNSTAANLLKRKTDLLEYLFTVGENSQGSWKMVELASIILFHVASHIEGIDNIDTSRERALKEKETVMENTGSSSSELGVSFLLKSNWDKFGLTNILKKQKTERNIVGHVWENSTSTGDKSNCIAASEEHTSLRSSLIDLITENNFIPNFTSTPKREIKKANKEKTAEIKNGHEIIAVKKSNSAFKCQWQARGNHSAPVIRQKLSTSARLFNIVNKSCVSVYKTVGNIIFRNTTHMNHQKGISKPISNINEGTPNNNFAHFLNQRGYQTDPKDNDTLTYKGALKQKILGIKQKHRDDVVKKLKSGIHFYGCNFKKISQTMWPQEKQMTPRVLYSIYRKYIAK